jgi:hypothetical protein
MSDPVTPLFVLLKVSDILLMGGIVGLILTDTITFVRLQTTEHGRTLDVILSRTDVVCGWAAIIGIVGICCGAIIA